MTNKVDWHTLKLDSLTKHSLNLSEAKKDLKITVDRHKFTLFDDAHCISQGLHFAAENIINLIMVLINFKANLHN
jgi:hypothetical protein